MSRKGVLWIIVIVLVLAAAGGAYYYYSNVYAQAQAPTEEPTITTAQVSQGDLVITASGSGTLVPSSEVSQGFRSSGVLAELLVEVGDRVEAGQLLARLDDIDVQDQIGRSAQPLAVLAAGRGRITRHGLAEPEPAQETPSVASH